MGDSLIVERKFWALSVQGKICGVCSPIQRMSMVLLSIWLEGSDWTTDEVHSALDLWWPQYFFWYMPTWLPGAMVARLASMADAHQTPKGCRFESCGGHFLLKPSHLPCMAIIPFSFVWRMEEGLMYIALGCQLNLSKAQYLSKDDIH